MFRLCGYSVNTETATSILEGAFVSPTITAASTLIILEEITRIWEKIGTRKVNIVLIPEEPQYHWKQAKEINTSSFSGMNFGHYKAAAYLDLLSENHALKHSLVT